MVRRRVSPDSSQLGFNFGAAPVVSTPTAPVEPLEEIVSETSDVGVSGFEPEGVPTPSYSPTADVEVAYVSTSGSVVVEPLPWEGPFKPRSYQEESVSVGLGPEETHLDFLDSYFSDEEFPTEEVTGHLDLNPPLDEIDMDFYDDISFGVDPYENIDLTELLPPKNSFPTERDAERHFWDVINGTNFDRLEHNVELWDGVTSLKEEAEACNELSLEDFTYHCDAEFESGQFGKCVMYLSPDNEVRFAIGKINPVLLARVDTSPELARNFFQRDMQDVVELHRYTYRDIPSERVHRKLGGGAYLVRSDETVVVDFESGDFGKMHLGLATRCLETKGLTIEIVDDKYWDKRTPVEYLEAKMKRS